VFLLHAFYSSLNLFNTKDLLFYKRSFVLNCGDRRFNFELLNQKSSPKMKKAFGSTRGTARRHLELFHVGFGTYK
jgi:hypothetical protein